MSTTPKIHRTTPRTRVQKIRLSGKKRQFEFGGWLSGRETYLRIEDPATNKVDWLQGRSLYRLAKAIVRRWESA